MGYCQFGTTQNERCRTKATVRVLFDGDYVGRICREHVEEFRAAYPPDDDIRFEDMRGRNEQACERTE